MKHLSLICALMLTACGPRGGASMHAVTSATRTAGAAHIEALVNPPRGRDAALCTRDAHWCAAKTPQVDGYTISYDTHPIATFHLESGKDIWTQIIRTPRADGGEDALIGITSTVEQAYSGGGGSATQVSLFPLSSATSVSTPPPPALTFPTTAALDIRACFSEADVRARRDACSDQYNFTGTLSLDTTATPPNLVLVTEATTYPAGISRNEDNTHALSARDLRTVRDPKCSYRRVFSWDAASQTYKPNAPLPACSDYLEP